jgi:hypothetical protein
MPTKKALASKLDPDSKLVNQLSVRDARHLLRTQGELGGLQLAGELIASTVVGALTARAIWVGSAGVWHLALPMVAQYLALLLLIPLLQAVVRHPDLRSAAIASLRNLALLVGGGAVVLTARSRQQDTAWGEQAANDLQLAWQWVRDAQMHWPILLAFVAMALSLVGKVRNLVVHGPPFVSISLGCAVRMILLVSGWLLLPLLITSPQRTTWFLWATMVLAEWIALGMHWDIQRRIRKIDGLRASVPL